MSETELTDALPSDLHYVDDAASITRKKLRGKFAYFEPSGQRITDPDNKTHQRPRGSAAYVDIVDLRRPLRSSASYRRSAED